MSAEKSMRCLYCNKRIWRFSFKQSSFCSELHEAWYQEEQSGEAIRRLLEPIESSAAVTENPKAASPEPVADASEASGPPPLPPAIAEPAGAYEESAPPLANPITERSVPQAPPVEPAAGFGPEEWLPMRALPFSYVGPLSLEDAALLEGESAWDADAVPVVNGNGAAHSPIDTGTIAALRIEPPLAGLILNLGSAAAPPENVAFVIEDPIELPVPVIPLFPPAAPVTKTHFAGPVDLPLTPSFVPPHSALGSLPEPLDGSGWQPIFPPLPGMAQGAEVQVSDSIADVGERPAESDSLLSASGGRSEPPLQEKCGVRRILPDPIRPEILSTPAVRPFAPRFAVARFSTRRPLLPPKTGHGYLARQYPFALPVSQRPFQPVVTHDLFSNLRGRSAALGDPAGTAWDIEVGIATPRWSVPAKDPAHQRIARLRQASALGLTAVFANALSDVELNPAVTQPAALTPGPQAFAAAAPIALRFPERRMRAPIELKPAIVKPRIRRTSELLAAHPEIRPPRPVKSGFTGALGSFGQVSCNFALRDEVTLPRNDAPALSSGAKVRPLLPPWPADSRGARGVVAVAYSAPLRWPVNIWTASPEAAVCTGFQEFAPQLQNPAGGAVRTPGIELSYGWFISWQAQRPGAVSAPVAPPASVETGVQIPCAQTIFNPAHLTASSVMPANWATRKSSPRLADPGPPATAPLGRKGVQLPEGISFFAPQAGTVQRYPAFNTAPSAAALASRVADILTGARRFSTTARVAFREPPDIAHGIRGLNHDALALTWLPRRFAAEPLAGRSVFRTTPEVLHPAVSGAGS
jgi:hypothetical protein